MGLFGILKSIEDLLYEIMTWVVFYPRTLWRVIRHPQQMIDYSELEQQDQPEDQYTDTLSPPLFLLLSIIIAHGLELQLGQKVEAGSGTLAKLFVNSEEALLIYRTIVFSIYPLMFALAVVKRGNADLDRKSLRQPYFSQCYVGALFALLVSASSLFLRMGTMQAAYAGFAMLLGTAAWYCTVQAVWLHRHLEISRVRSSLVALGTFLKASFLSAIVSSVFLA